jgi:hypothetical protein
MGLMLTRNRQGAIMITAGPLVLVAGMGMTMRQPWHALQTPEPSEPTAASRDVVQLARVPEPAQPAQSTTASD